MKKSVILSIISVVLMIASLVVDNKLADAEVEDRFNELYDKRRKEEKENN